MGVPRTPGSPLNGLSAQQAHYQLFNHGHEDLVREVDFNLYGTRLVTASSDQRIKVYNKEPEGDKWKLCDTWRAHDAEVNCAAWISPFLGHGIGTIGEDGKFKIWLEDEQEATNSGRRFRCIYTTMSSSRVPYVSLSFTSVDISTIFVALLSRDGQLQVFEAAEPESLGSWVLIDQLQTSALPAREEETSYKVQFDPSQRPCYAAVRAGVEKDALSLVVASQDHATVWRTGSDRRFYQVADLPHNGLVRDVAWAPRSSRGVDLIATACKDGHIRIFELTSPTPAPSSPTFKELAFRPPPPAVNAQTRGGGARNAPSGIGAGLAGATRINGTAISSRAYAHGQVTAHVNLIADLEDNHREAWRLKWSQNGIVLASGGDDGKIRMWRRAHTNTFLPSAELAPETDKYVPGWLAPNPKKPAFRRIQSRLSRALARDRRARRGSSVSGGGGGGAVDGYLPPPCPSPSKSSISSEATRMGKLIKWSVDLLVSSTKAMTSSSPPLPPSASRSRDFAFYLADLDFDPFVGPKFEG